MKIERKSEGVGDTIAKFTAATGIDKVAQAVANLAGYKDCGCNERKEALNDPNLLVNKMFYKKNQNQNEEELGQ